MPMSGFHVAAIAVTQSALAVRDLGVAGAVSVAAASALGGIAHKRAVFAISVARAAATDADADQAKRATIENLTTVS